MNFSKILSIVILIFASQIASAQSQEPANQSKNCGDMQIWDYAMEMCMPVPMHGMPMSMLMLCGNSFFTQTVEEKPRGRDAFSVPDMIMADIGSTVGEHHYLNVDLMATFEKWTFPANGTPELLQIGEEQSNGQPFLDAQHPHSSPIMGLTFSDTISLGGGKNYLKVWFAPRGESTDGPIAFMHRPTGMVNPDAPLGHHVGQDVGHISSTVVGASIKTADTILEVSTFYGTEPQPTSVDLPTATPNSYAARLTQQLTKNTFMMASAAFVQSPEPDAPEISHIWRYSASIYSEFEPTGLWHVHNALIWGLINYFDHAGALNSFAEEFWLENRTHNFWGRLEVLQRTPNELQIANLGSPNDGQWVDALTLGYTETLFMLESARMGIGGSVTKDFLPSEFQNAYAGNPLTAKIFIRVSGMKMWDL